MLSERKIELFSLSGFKVSLDPSWFILAVLITWSLATSYFPFSYENLSKQTYWLMGVAGALGLFVSIVLHEFAHSWVARRNGLPMKGITLFIFGGVAEMTEEPPSPEVEFRVAVAGPIASIVISVACFAMTLAGRQVPLPVPVTGVLAYLALINLVLVAFNAVPAFPLDGGRVLRSVLWRWKEDLRWATRITSRIGGGFGLLLIGTIGGLILGATPGLSPKMAVALLIPFTFQLEAAQGLILLGAAYTSTVAGGGGFCDFVENSGDACQYRHRAGRSHHGAKGRGREGAATVLLVLCRWWCVRCLAVDLPHTGFGARGAGLWPLASVLAGNPGGDRDWIA